MRPDLIGRVAEIEALDRVLERLLAVKGVGRAEFVAVSGEPGIGKTRLLGELCARAEDGGGLVLEGRGTEFERELPFAVVVDALDDYLGSLHPRRLEPLGADRLAELGRAFPSLAEFAGGAGLEAERYRLHRAVRALLELLAARSPLVLVLDDIHWADPASLELLLHLLRHPPGANVVVAVAFRHAQVDADLSAQLAVAAGEGDATLLSIGPLSEREIGQLVGAKAGAERARELYADSGGNPFYALQLMRAPAALSSGDHQSASLPDAPVAVVAAIERELTAASDPARGLLDGAAVAGDPFELGLAAAAAELAERDGAAALDELLRLELVYSTDVPTQFRFRHPIVRGAVYAASGAGWRIGAHARVAAELERRGVGALGRAHHVERSAKPGDEAAVALLEEAAQATAPRAPATAAGWLEAALRLLGVRDDPRRLGLLIALAASQAAAGRLAQSLETAAEALAALPSQAGSERVRLIAGCASVEHLLGRHDSAHRRLVRALAEVGDERSAEAISLRVELSADAYYLSDYEGARAHAAQALEAARRLGDAGLTAAAATLTVYADSCLGKTEAAERLLPEAVAMIDRLDDAALAGHLSALFYLGWCEYFLERYDAAITHVRRGARLARSTGQSHFLVFMKIPEVMALTARGRLDDALDLAASMVDGARLSRNPYMLCYALACACWAITHSGRSEEAVGAGSEALALARDLDRDVVSDALNWALAAACLDAGDPGRAQDLLAEIGAPEFAQLEPTCRCICCELMARAALAQGRLEQAQTWAERADAAVCGSGLSVAEGRAARARALALLAHAEAPESARLALAAAAGAQQRGAPIEAARSRIVAGRALAAAGDTKRAIAELERAHRELDACDSLRSKDEAAAELRRLGQKVTRTRTRAENVVAGSLSARELEVAQLVADGRTNKEIAAALYLSEKTVEKHLANVFEKLGLSRRGAVAAKLAEQRERSAV